MIKDIAQYLDDEARNLLYWAKVHQGDAETCSGTSRSYNLTQGREKALKARKLMAWAEELRNYEG